MEHKILIGYASRTGSTGEVARRIAQELEQEGAAVDVQELAAVTDLSPYSAVVAGSSILFGRWLDPAVAFLDRFADALAERPVALFMTCLTITEGTESARETALSYWEPVLQRLPGVEPVGLGLFAGSLVPELGKLPEYKDTPYGDYRDWPAIAAWAQEVRPALLSGEPRASLPMVLSGSILSYSDLSGYDLSHFDFRETEMVQVRLQEARLRQADLRQAVLPGGDLRGADLKQARLGWSNMRQAQCQNADFSLANLMGANLEEANLENADLSHVILNGALLSHANLRGVELRGADLNWADLRGADLTGARLAYATLGWANLRGARLDKANLQDARYNSHTNWPNGFSPEKAGCILAENVGL